jgi:hypothetical protein
MRHFVSCTRATDRWLPTKGWIGPALQCQCDTSSHLDRLEPGILPNDLGRDQSDGRAVAIGPAGAEAGRKAVGDQRFGGCRKTRRPPRAALGPYRISLRSRAIRFNVSPTIPEHVFLPAASTGSTMTSATRCNIAEPPVAVPWERSDVDPRIPVQAPPGTCV